MVIVGRWAEVEALLPGIVSLGSSIRDDEHYPNVLCIFQASGIGCDY